MSSRQKARLQQARGTALSSKTNVQFTEECKQAARSDHSLEICEVTMATTILSKWGERLGASLVHTQPLDVRASFGDRLPSAAGMPTFSNPQILVDPRKGRFGSSARRYPLLCICGHATHQEKLLLRWFAQLCQSLQLAPH